ncbi:protein C-mannosyl-transferase DPY19L3-like [Tubulanus polymorphus]|uniref:protein C-mannosyl-transferase DPY19L3-like n=1 Tax=Tubulanus polymorphus TaxID=672921 RepID=UPI003DA4F868
MASNSDVRKRKSRMTQSADFKKKNASNSKNINAAKQGAADQGKNEAKPGWNLFGILLSISVGLVLMTVVSYKHAEYMFTIHENNLWFSNIKEVEREISFRTESGLYYSYFKDMIKAPSIFTGLKRLIYNNDTEHLRTINILQRFNIYQEVVLNVLYEYIPIRLFNLIFSKLQTQPIFFYINSVFVLHGCLVSALFVMAWMLSSSWLAGVLASLFYIFNRIDTTRVAYTIPLRESFALPFLWIQLTLVTWFFRPNMKREKLCLWLMGIAMFCFTMAWQFAQFVLLLQAFAIFGTAILEIIPIRKAQRVMLIQMCSVLLVAILQFGNQMMLSALVLSFIPAAFVVFYIKGPRSSGNFLVKIIKLVVYIVLVFVLTAAINVSVKVLITHESDAHVFKFVLKKLGMGDPRDFDTNLYICNGGFEFLPYDTFERLTGNLVLPFYIGTHCVLLLALVHTVFKFWCGANKDPSKFGFFSQRPELAYITIQIVFFAGMAMTTLRFKYLWTPFMCVLGAVGIADFGFWRKWLPKQFDSFHVDAVRHGVTVIVIAALYMNCMPAVTKELEDLREFYDPDTVQLMEWINKSTLKGAAFTGSMQLLAGVKLCTGRPLTNHPHYEDKVLRERTLELYQMYAKTEPEVMYDIFRKYDVSYFILEDSICLVNKADGCGLPSLLDLDNGLIPDGFKPQDVTGLKRSNVPRFCNEIRYGKPAYMKFFKLVLHNKTFRVYQVLTEPTTNHK